MQSMQRRFGKLLPRSADESQVAILLNDFDEADRMLQRLIDATKLWRDAWRDILGAQYAIVCEFNLLYQPIMGATGESSERDPVMTPEHLTNRSSRLEEGYAELKMDLTEEVSVLEQRITTPAVAAKDYIQPMKKVIKKRQDRKLDYERHQSKYDSAVKKKQRSDKENQALGKIEFDLAKAKEEYSIADAKLKSGLPPIITATFSLLPSLLAAQIMIQNTLLGHYYTYLHNYCQEEGYPSPPPPMLEVVQTWEQDYRPVQSQIEENLVTVSSGQNFRQLKLKERERGLNVRNGTTGRKPSSHSLTALQPSISSSGGARTPSPEPAPREIERTTSFEPESRPRILSVPSQTSLALSMPNYSSSAIASPSPNDLYTPHAPAGPRGDYFSRDRTASSSSNLSAIAASKKKPPPPPPKRLPSMQNSLYVTALYDFAGQGQGDLVFREGDSIRIVRKTESQDDWWEGELHGVKGSFPANYCQRAG